MRVTEEMTFGGSGQERWPFVQVACNNFIGTKSILTLSY